MKTSKITQVEKDARVWDNPKGKTLYYRNIELENGDKGSIGTTANPPAWLAVGKDLEYTIDGDKIKKFNDKSGARPQRSSAAVAPKVSGVFPIGMDKMLFVSVETVGAKSEYSLLGDNTQLFNSAFEFYSRRFEHDSVIEAYAKAAGTIPEFSHIVSICLSYTKEGQLISKTLPLKVAVDTMNTFYGFGYTLVGHNVKSFVLPLLAKKSLMERIKPPMYAPKVDQKPWELKVMDTKHYYQFGDGYGLSSREAISHAAGLKTGTEMIKGSEIHNLYWSKKLTKEMVDKSATAKNQWLYSFVKFINDLK